jgi:transposase-like protein
MGYRRLDERAAIVAEYEGSGLSQGGFARARGVPEGSLRRWVREAESARVDEAAPRQAFVRLVTDRPEAQAAGAQSTASARVRPSSSGVSLRVGPVCLDVACGFDEGVLAGVLAVILGASRGGCPVAAEQP